MKKAIKSVKHFLGEWSKTDCLRMSATLSYYTIFSLAPLLLLLVAVAGLAFGREAVEGRIVEQLGGLLGRESAANIQSMMRSAWKPAQGILAAAIGVISLLAGATGVLSELKHGLNRIWQAHEKDDLGKVAKDRAKFLGLILGIGFLLIVSLAVSAVLAALGNWFSATLPFPKVILHLVDLLVSFATISVLFACLFHFLPDTRIAWRQAAFGGAITSVLFIIGKYALGFFLGRGLIGSSYGQAGSLLIILLWIYYPAVIFYTGGLLTRMAGDRVTKRR